MVFGTPAARRTCARSLLLALLPLCLTAPESAAQYELGAAVLSETGASSQAGGTTLETSGGQAIIGVAAAQDIDLGLGYIYVSGDRQPPETVLLVNGLVSSATSLVLASTDSLGFFAIDSGVGIRGVRARAWQNALAVHQTPQTYSARHAADDIWRMGCSSTATSETG